MNSSEGDNSTVIPATVWCLLKNTEKRTYSSHPVGRVFTFWSTPELVGGYNQGQAVIISDHV